MKLKDIFEAEDMSALDDATFKSIQSEMQTLAKDDTKEWSSALSLVHDAYEIIGVERPTPAMRAAWSQYEDLMTNAVQYLNKYHPEGNWRITSVNSKVTL